MITDPYKARFPESANYYVTCEKWLVVMSEGKVLEVEASIPGLREQVQAMSKAAQKNFKEQSETL